ncbi:Ig-like domain-containing protein [Cloacibacillus porcorum]|uniref:Ig-like domain-containing protein n=1 Tax=Cloacibacillus porcorum TaxID=1197717 RepID=UPI0026737D04|nr:Ig-like domain-containing protein [Cloacibacillus porcorum]
MKRTAWIFAALCAVLVLSISAVAGTTGGVHYKLRGEDTWGDKQDGYITNIEKAQLYGEWRDKEIGLYGVDEKTGDATTSFDLVLSGDFDFKRSDTPNAPWLFVCGGIAGGNNINAAITRSGGSWLNVTANSGAKFDLSNGGVSFLGGDFAYSGNSVTTNETHVVLGGDSPVFIPDMNDENDFGFYGGSHVSNKSRHVTSGDSGITLAGPWKMAEPEGMVDVGVLYGGDQAYDDGSTSIIKGISYAYLGDDDCAVSAVYAGSAADSNSLSYIEGTTDLRLRKGSFERAVAGSWARGKATAYVARTNVEIRNIRAINDAVVYGGGYAGSQNNIGHPDLVSHSIVSGDTYILVEPKDGFVGRGVNRIFGGGYSRGPGMAEVRGSTNIVISGDLALEVIKPQDEENTWAHISAGGYRRANTTVSNDVKGDGNITFKNITDISKLMHNTTLNGQGHLRKADKGAELELYPNSVVGTSRLIFDNVKGTTSARTFQFDEIIFKNGSNMTFRHSLSQLYSDDDRDKETATLIVEKGSTLRIAPDTIDNTGDPVLGNAKIDGTLIIEDGMTLILNNSLEKGEGAKIEGNIVVRKVNPEEPPIKPDDVNVIPVKPETVKSVDDLPAGVPALVEKQPNGDIVVTSAKFAAAVASSDVNGTVDTTLIKSIPVFKTIVSADKTALASFRGRLDEFSSHKFKDIVLCKVIPGKVLKFAFQSLPKKIESGEFAITTADGAAVDVNASPEAGVEYLISFAVADNSEYDLDKAKGNILDPAVLSVNQYRLTLSATELLLAEGQSKTLKVSGFAPGATPTWKSSNDKVAAIKGLGEEITVKALSAGEANITVTDDFATVTCRVTVTKGGSGGSSGGGCNSGLAAVVLAAFIPLFFRRKSKAVH